MTCPRPCQWSCPLCGTAMEPPCSYPSPALRGAERVSHSVQHRVDRAAMAPWRTCWLRRTAGAALVPLVLVVAVACALPPHTLADGTASTTMRPSTTALLADPDDGSLRHNDSSDWTSPRSHHISREDSDEDRYYGSARRPHSAEQEDDVIEVPAASSERRHGGSRHRGAGEAAGGGGRGGPRKQQQGKKKAVDDVLMDDRLPPPPGHGGSCSQCREREALRDWSLDAIKTTILHKLNLHHPPNMTGRRLPKYDHLADLVLDPQPHRGHGGHGGYAHGMLGDDPDAGVFRPSPEMFEEEDDYHAKTERIIAFPQTHSNKVRHSYQGQNVLHFRFSSKVMQSQVAKATLWLYLRGTGNRHPRHRRHHHTHPYLDASKANDEEDVLDEDERPVVLSVMRMRSRGSATPDAPVPYELETTTKMQQPQGDGVWVMVDVKKMVEDWFRRPRDNLGLVVYTNPSADADGKHLVNTNTNEEDNPKVPFIEVFLKDGRKRRVRRSMGLNCDENSDEVRCCRYPLIVDFERFGWDFIIFPKRYQANYCSGECPYVYMQKYPHTAIMHLARNKTGPCCAPRKMSPINMLYFDHDLNVVFGVLPGMVVERCGCF